MAEQLNGKPQLRNTWKRIALDNIALHVLYFHINSFTCANADFSQINQREHSFKVNILLTAFWGAYQFWNILEGTWGEGDGCSWPRHIFPACFCKWNSRSRSTFRTLKFPLKIDNPFLSFLWWLLPNGKSLKLCSRCYCQLRVSLNFLIIHQQPYFILLKLLVLTEPF